MRTYKSVFTILLVITAVFMLVSCEKKASVDAPEPFDPDIDGIAVRGMQELDLALAERIVRDKGYSPIADATQEADLASAAPIVETTTTTPTTSSSTPPTGDGSTNLEFDPNSF